MDFKDFREKVGRVIIGDSAHDTARVIGGVTLVSTVSQNEPANLVRANRIMDEFWARDRKKIPMRWVEQFLDELEADREKYSRIYSMAANHNRLVNDGTRMLSRWFTNIATNSAAGNAINNRIGYLQLGADGSNTHNPAATGCYTPIVAPAGLVEAAATLTQVTTDATYTFDTAQLRKTDFVNTAGNGTKDVKEIAMRNNDAVKICFARTFVTTVTIADGGNLDATYKWQIQP